ncbi:transglutaminase family protein [Curvibacter delicatus]|jgi:transglutaminase-like putative cysteine protease|uniref:transglutaminase family protein n=1 Tax=Curvibacter delicatus TaxID=80879 RepID=UPI00082D05FF|nr:transglutaminase family protein [Curvibacter delicatus]
MLLDIRHETLYRYAVPASYSLQYMRLWPRADGGQRVLNWRIDAPGRRWGQTDAYGNAVFVTSLTEQHHEIRVVAQGQVETSDERGLLLPHDSAVPPQAFALATPLTEADAAIHALAAEALGSTPCSELDGPAPLQTLTDAIFKRVAYVQGVTDVFHTAAEVLQQGQGVCQDMAHVFLACCRARGIPARYVSGYLLTDATHAASHAWAEAWLPKARGGAGAWIGFDVTHQRMAGPELCRLAVGRDYADASPLRGIHVGGGGEALAVHVAVQGADQ